MGSTNNKQLTPFPSSPGGEGGGFEDFCRKHRGDRTDHTSSAQRQAGPPEHCSFPTFRKVIAWLLSLLQPGRRLRAMQTVEKQHSDLIQMRGIKP